MNTIDKKEHELRIEIMRSLLEHCTREKCQFATDVYQVISRVIEADEKTLGIKAEDESKD